MDTQTQTHAITLSERKSGTLSGVTAVLSYSEEELCLSCIPGKLIISGKGLKIVSFDEKSGGLELVGEVNSVKYAAKKQPLVKRLFK